MTTAIEARPTGVRAGGEAAFLVTAVLVHAGNYLFNVVLSRMLGPSSFAELNLVVTLLLMLTVVTHTVQLVAARATAELDVTRGVDAARDLHGWLRRRAAVAGAVAGVVLAGGAPLWQVVFNSPSTLPYVVFGVGLPFFVVLGADRGFLQGRAGFRRLAIVNVVEMGVRLVVGVVLVALGAGVLGAVAAISLSFVAAGLVARDRSIPVVQAVTDQSIRRAAQRMLGPSLVLLLGQIVVANSDVLVVKASVSPAVAGQYAALALVGRAVFYVTWSLVEVAFPLAAREFHEGGRENAVVRRALAATAAIGAVAVAVTAIAPSLVVGVLFGDAYAAVEPLLWRYTMATVLFSLVFVVANHQLARGEYRATWLLLGGAGLQLAAVIAVRADLARVVDVQVAVMAVLLIAVRAFRPRSTPAPRPSTRPTRTVASATA